MKRKIPKPLRLLTTAALALAVLLIALYSVYMLWERPPEKAQTPLAAKAPALPQESPAGTGTPAPEPTPTETPEESGIYTLLLVGNDDGNGNTDAILLCRLDTAERTLRFVSIPRDTLVNLDWEVRKINAVYWGDRLRGGNGIDALCEQVRALTGFAPDGYLVLDLEDLIAAVDLLGGLRFEVPRAMHYDDPSQNLHIHLEPGEQLLDGEQVMGLCRYRSGYASGDLGRIEMQQRFLRACVERFSDLGSVPHLMQAAEYLAQAADTDLSAANMAWFVRQGLKCREEGLRFETLPTEPATIHGYSYAVVRLWDWLHVINESLNPFDEAITAADLDLVYRSGGGFAATGALRGGGYYARTQPVSAPAVQAPPAGTPEAAAEDPAPTETPAPGPKIITVTPG